MHSCFIEDTVKQLEGNKDIVIKVHIHRSITETRRHTHAKNIDGKHKDSEIKRKSTLFRC